MKDLFFEDVQLGHVGRSGLYHLTKGEIIDFATHYDPRPFHIDEEAAARSVFGGLIASSAHTHAIQVRLAFSLSPWFSENVLAGLGYDEVRFPNPARPGDVLEYVTTVIDLRESKSKPDRGVIRAQGVLGNARNEPVLTLIANILVTRRPA